MYAECKLPDDYSTFLKFGSKLEAAVAIGILLNKPSITGVIGSTKALEIIAKDTLYFCNVGCKKVVNIFKQNLYLSSKN